MSTRCLDDLACLDRRALLLQLHPLKPPDKDVAETLVDLGWARRRAEYDGAGRVRAVRYQVTPAGLAAARGETL
jgi:hypothetical protein